MISNVTPYGLIKKEKKWIKGKTELFDARVGYDPYELEDSIYKYGTGEYLLDIIQITKEEAEAFISECIDEDDIAYLIHLIIKKVDIKSTLLIKL